jgi:uncharacterized protein (DUF58 family)
VRTLTTRGRALLAAGLVCAGAGWGLGEPPIIAVAFLLIALPVLAILIARRSRFVLGSQRAVEPTRFAVGTDAEVVLTIENGSRLPSGVLLLQDAVPENLSDSARVVLDRIPSRAQRAVRYRVTGLERGRGRIGPLTVTVTDPFGMSSLTRSFEATNPIIVTPEIVELADAGRSVAPGGRGESLFRSLASRGDEDVLPREHRPGDDMRRIHWRATARYGELMVRREEQAWHSRLVVIIDNRGQAHTGEGLASTFEWAVSAAASIAMHHLRRGWHVTVLTANGHVLIETNGASPSDVDGVLQAFAEVRLTGEPMAPTLGALVEGATSVVAVLGRVSDETTRALIRPMAGFTACLVLEPGPIEFLETHGWQAAGWSRRSQVADVWVRVLPAVAGVSS